MGKSGKSFFKMHKKGGHCVSCHSSAHMLRGMLYSEYAIECSFRQHEQHLEANRHLKAFLHR